MSKTQRELNEILDMLHSAVARIEAMQSNMTTKEEHPHKCDWANAGSNGNFDRTDVER